MANVIGPASGNIFVPFNGSDPSQQKTTIKGSEDQDAVYVVSSGGTGLIEEFFIETFAGEDAIQLNGSAKGVTVDAGDGNDDIEVDDMDEIKSYFLNSTFIGGTGNDYFDIEVGGSGSQFLGGAGEDYFELQEAYTAITVTGDEGYDRVEVNGLLTGSNFFMGEGNDSIKTGDRVWTTLFSGGIGEDNFLFQDPFLRKVTLSGDDGDDKVEIAGNYGYNQIKLSNFNLGAGEDTLISANGDLESTTISGGSDNDRILITESGAEIKTSLIQGEGGDDVIESNSSKVTSSTLLGGDGDDKISLTESDRDLTSSWIRGGSGNDTIESASSSLTSVTITGDDGNDFIKLTEAEATIKTSRLAAGLGNDTISSASSTLDTVTVLGGNNDDLIEFTEAGKTALSSLITGGTGADAISFSSGTFKSMTVRGNDGNDTITVSESSVTIEDSFIQGGNNDDILNITPSITNSLIGGGNGVGDFTLGGTTFSGLTLNGGDSNDTIDFTNANSITDSIISTGDLNDNAKLRGVISTSTITGGTGDDVFKFTAVITGTNPGGFSSVSVNLGDGDDSLLDDSNALLFASSTIVGGIGNDTIDLNSSNGVDGSGLSIEGGDGSDNIYSPLTAAHTIQGGAGNDSIVSYVGSDFIDAGIGADTVESGLGSDSVDGGSEIDYIFSDYSDTLPSGTGGADTVNGGSEADLIFGGFVSGEDTSNALNGDNGADIIVGGNKADTINAGTDAVSDTLIGAGGDDTLVGSEGDNWIFGDVYGAVDNGTATTSGFSFSDINFISASGVNFQQANAQINTSQTNQSTANSGVPSGFGNGQTIAYNYWQPNYPTDGAAFGIVNQILDADVPNVYSGFQKAGADSITGGDGNNVIFGGGANDTIASGSGTDNIIGGDGADSITGGAGNDLFIQGTGSSVIPTQVTGNLGAGYTISFNNGVDVITDFKTGTLNSPLDKMAFQGWNNNFTSNLGSPLGAVVQNNLIVYSGNYTQGNKQFATTTSSAGADVLVFLAANNRNASDLLTGDVLQAVVLLGAGGASSQSISATNFI